MHLLIPFAVGDDPASRVALRGLRLPHLARLLQRLSPRPLERGRDADPALPHERVLARAQGLDPAAPLPWAALRARELGLPGAADRAWAFITPCHWEVGQSRVTLLDPQALALREDESQALLAAMRPYFAEDGLALHFERADRWLAAGELFRDLRTASPARAIGRDITPWMPPQPQLRRLQNEMQMLLYTQPVNEARTQRRQLPVNSCWISGAGVLPPEAKPALAPPPTLSLALQDATLRGDWPAWARAWQALDAEACAALLAALDQGADVQLTLCGEHHAQTWTAAPRPLWARLRAWLRPPPLSTLLEPLCN